MDRSWAGVAVRILFCAHDFAVPVEDLCFGVRDPSFKSARRNGFRVAGTFKFRLRYFSTKRDGNKGWFELTLQAGEAKIVAESTLDGFDDLLEISRDWAKDNQLLVDDVTRTNLMRMDEAETLVKAAASERT